MAVLEAVALSKMYRGGTWTRKRTVALDDVSLEAGEGEIVGLLGLNGAGKTTFVKALLGATIPDAGTVMLFGRDPADPVSKRQIGYLPEEFPVDGQLTGEQFLFCYGGMSGLKKKILREQIERWGAELEISDLLGRRINSYSKGTRQRLGIAQALLAAPRLVILDEPTDGLDPRGRIRVREILRGIRDSGGTVFLNSHHLSEIEMLCDRVAILDRGKIVRVAGVGELVGGSAGYEIRIARLALERLRDDLTGAQVREEGPHAVILLDDRSRIDAFVDLLRGRGIHIEEMGERGMTLEAAFIRSLHRPEEGASH